MTYSLNDVPLDNPAHRWVFRASSKPLAELELERTSVTSQGRHGVTSVGGGVLTAPLVRLVVRTPREHLRALETLLRAGGQLASTYEDGIAVVELVSLTPMGFGSGESSVEVTAVFRVPAGAARGVLATSADTVLGSASVMLPGLFPGLSLEVQDAVVRVKGAFTGLQVADSGGSWFTYADAVSGSQWLRFEADTGRAFLTTSAAWSGGTEVSGAVDFGGPRGVFEIAPAWSSDPSVRAGVLTVATASRASASIQVRGQAAYLV